MKSARWLAHLCYFFLCTTLGSTGLATTLGFGLCCFGRDDHFLCLTTTCLTRLSWRGARQAGLPCGADRAVLGGLGLGAGAGTGWALALVPELATELAMATECDGSELATESRRARS